MATDVSFVGVRIQGGLLPAELLSRLATGRGVDGMSSSDYRLAAGESVREAANRVWAYLTGVWAGYQAARERLPEGDPATSLTRERWLLILLDQLGYGRVPTVGAGGIQIDGKAFAVSHQLGSIPIHLLGAGVDLDRRSRGVAGAATSSPQSMVQELLNRSDDYLWAILSNGKTLRLLRDSTSLVGSAYVEFDLEAIFEGELFSDFLLLYTLCHHSRLDTGVDGKGPASSWLESWREASLESGSRALNQLRDGVVEAIQALGTGFLAHPGNGGLRDGVAAHSLSLPDVNHALLRVVYRLLFTFVAEDRGVLLAPEASPAARQRYAAYFSTARLRRIARRRRGGRHGDLWRALNLVWDGLGATNGRPEIGIHGIGGLFQPGELDFLGEHELSNESLLRAVRALSVIREPQSGFTRVVDHRNLGAEELGSIYESLLEFVPSWDPGTRTFTLGSAAGNARKTTGSYYTPTSLIDSLLDTALDPVLDRAATSDDPESAYLSLTVCDPACGSGHFLVAAARRIAKRVAALRTGDPEPPPEQVRSAMSEVVGRCIYGVDVNPLAAELAKVSLWLETMDPGRPLAFLDAQIKVGNALIGTTPSLLADALPDAAFQPIEGDDKTVAKDLAKQNKAERSGQGSLFESDEVYATNSRLAEQLEKVIGSRVLSLADVHVAQQRLHAYEESDDYRRQRLAADAWCAAFVWPKTIGAPKAVTHDTVRRIERGEQILAETRDEIDRLAAAYRFFHWHLEFPHVFPTGGKGSVNHQTGWSGGFDLVIGNPPWEHVELKEQEFFDARAPEIARAAGAKRKRLIAALPTSNPPLASAYQAAKRTIDGLRHFAADSGRYPLCGRGRIKTDSVFAELGRDVLAAEGRFGLVLPTGIATDATTQYFFKDLVRSAALVSLYDFENAKPLFDGVHRSFKFCLLTLAGRDHREERAEFAFFAHDPSDLAKPDVRFGLTPEEITLLNPNTGTCPIFRSRRAAEITLGIYRRVPVLINENDSVTGNPWGVRFMQGLFNMTSDSGLFRTRNQLEEDDWVLYGNTFERGTEGLESQRMLPLYEAKMIHHFDHRWATYDQAGSVRDVTLNEKRDPEFQSLPRYWVGEHHVIDAIAEKWDQDWILGWRDICRSTDERTMIAAINGAGASPEGGTLLCLPDPPEYAIQLLSVFNSFAFDFVARQKVGGTHLKFFTMRQLPVPNPRTFTAQPLRITKIPLGAWIADRVLGLILDCRDMTPLAEQFDRELQADAWEPDARRGRRAELDALMFHLYGIGREDVDYIMETFPIVKRKDIAVHGEYRTKRLILEVYDAMAKAIEAGVPYESPLDSVLPRSGRG